VCSPRLVWPCSGSTYEGPRGATRAALRRWPTSPGSRFGTMTALLALMMSLVLPGIAGGVLLSRLDKETPPLGVLLTRCLATGTAVWLITSGLLALTIGITKQSSWVSEVVLAIVSIAALALPHSRRVLHAARAEAGYLAGILLVLLFSWLPVSALIVKTSWAPLGSTPWYYWSLAQRVAENGHVPATTTEWGVTLPFLDDYHLFTTGTAMLLAQGGSLDVRGVQVVTLLSAMLLACGAALLANALGAGAVASLAAVPVTVATGIGSIRLAAYRPEVFGAALSLLVVAAFLSWFRRRDRGSLLAGCLLGATLANVHGIALLAAGLMLVSSVAATLPREHVWAHLRRGLWSGGVLLIGAVTLGFVLKSASGNEHAGGLANTDGVADPTWRFITALRGHRPSLPPTNSRLLESALRTAYHGTTILAVVLIAITILILVIAVAKGDDVARRTCTFVIVSIILMAVIGAVLAFGWASYVPRRTGAQRLPQEATLLLGVLVAVAVAVTAKWVPRLDWRPMFTAGLVLVLCVSGFAANTALERTLRYQRPSAAAVSSLSSFQFKPGSVILTNAYTEGYIDQLTDARGLLEGRAPFTFPSLLSRANGLLTEAAAFFHEPCRRLEFLRRHHVSYVAVTPVSSYSLGTASIFVDASRPKLAGCPALKQVHSASGLVIYEVHLERDSSQ
jgi:hypothetical protein